tara:strand:+ start:405 stop:1115 length:711 start_codon:yes stop_codon:yes gene_type:complete
MIEPTRDNLELHWHESSRGGGYAGGGWFYYINGKSDNRRRFGSGDNENDLVSKAKAVEACLPFAYGLYLEQQLAADSRNTTHDEYSKRIRDNITVCKLSDETPLDEVIRWRSDPQSVGLRHMDLLVGEKACYKMDFNGFYNLDNPSAGNILLTVETSIELQRQDMAKLKPKAQKPHIEFACRRHQLPKPKSVKDYPATWEILWRMQATIGGAMALMCDRVLGSIIEQPTHEQPDSQ